MNEKRDQVLVDDIIKALIIYVGDKTSESKSGPAIISWKDYATFGAKDPRELVSIIDYAKDNDLLKGPSGQTSQLRLTVRGTRMYEELS